MGVGSQRHAPAALPPEKTQYPLYKRLGRPQGRSGRVRKISHTPRLDPRTVQPVACRYTDCAIPAHVVKEVKNASTLHIYFDNLYNSHRILQYEDDTMKFTPQVALDPRY